MSKIDLAVYSVVGCVGCLMLVIDAGAPIWLAAPLSLVTVLFGARPVRRNKAESSP